MRDWTKTIQLAQRLISANGRSVEFIREVPSTPDESKPWRTETPEASQESIKLDAVFVPPSGAAALGFSVMEDELFKKASQIAIVAPALNATYDLTEFHKVVEASSKIWRFSGSQKLQPGDTTLLYFIGMKE